MKGYSAAEQHNNDTITQIGNQLPLNQRGSKNIRTLSARAEAETTHVEQWVNSACNRKGSVKTGIPIG